VAEAGRKSSAPRGRGPSIAVLAGLVAVAIAIGLTAVVSSRGDAVVDFGAVPGPDQPRLPADGGLRVGDVDVALAPELESVLTDGGWDEAAAFIARNAAADRPTVINLFASWCGPCEREMPLLNSVADQESGVVFLGVAHLDARRDAERFVEEQQVRFTTILDLDGAVAAAVGGRGLPVTVAFDRDGVMVGRVFGELTDVSLEELIALVR
jgi:thiol-disulfide isomerase/thioredoxin